MLVVVFVGGVVGDVVGWMVGSVGAILCDVGGMNGDFVGRDLGSSVECGGNIQHEF